MKVLIAEDEPSTMIILQSSLKKWGYDIACTDNGEDAYSQLSCDQSIQLALIDWMLPKLHGTGLCRLIRKMELNKPIYIIIITQRDTPEDIVEGLEAGADDYIIKPFRSNELKARIDVGKRIVTMQNELIKFNKAKGSLEMAGTVCHEINQPLQVISGYNEILIKILSKNESAQKMLLSTKDQIDKISKITRKIMNLKDFVSKSYIGGESSIIDIDKLCKNESLNK